MNEKQLQSEILKLHDEGIGKSTIGNDFFFEQPQYRYLKEAFESSKYYKQRWNWHQLVRIVLEPPEIRQYMYDRLLSLILEHRRTFEDYFELKTVEGSYQIPNALADLNRLEILFQKYFQIYHNIKNNIQFDYPDEEFLGPTLRGKINWSKTIKNNPTEFPMMFYSKIRQKDFETPENILLVLCAERLYKKSSQILQTKFTDPLSSDKLSILQNILTRTKIILDSFPFPSVLNLSRKYWNLLDSDPRIKSLEEEARVRINQKLVRNSQYASLLLWIEEFRDLNLEAIGADTPSRHILESVINLDTVYEAWIFLEFVNYLHNKGILINLQLGKHARCQFDFNGVIVTFWYEKFFSPNNKEKLAWAVPCNPDFTAMVDDQIIAIFDAKNYSKGKNINETKVKMLFYMLNLDASFGALIYPNHPQLWDELKPEQKTEKIILHLRKNPKNNISNPAKEANLMKDRAWKDLPEEYQGIMPHGIELFKYPKDDQTAKFHHDQTLGLLRMAPIDDENFVQMKNKTLDAIFDAITKKVPIIKKL